MAGLQSLNRLPAAEARRELSRCCGSKRWSQEMARRRPFKDEAELLAAAKQVWLGLRPADWLEAFSHHPEIGDKEALRAKFSEQATVASAAEDVLEGLARGNRLYKAKFGYIFIVCATGKSAVEMLGLLNQRLDNSPETEILTAAEEQSRITQIRLEKLLKS